MLADPSGYVLNDRRGLLRREAQPLQLEADDKVLAQWTAAIAHRSPQDPGHAGVPLDPRHGLVVETRDPHDRTEQVREHRLLHPGLAQGGQHLLDVGQEEPVRAHHQHALALQGEPVGVEEIGGPVKGHDRLAGPRSALHHQHTGQLGTDHPVLLPLDGGHDILEATGSSLLQRSNQSTRHGPAVERAVAGHGLTVGGAVEIPVSDVEADGGLVAEEFVLDAQQRAAPGREVPSALQAERLPAGGTVEGLGHRRPPVHHDRVVVGIPQADAPDVETLRSRGRIDSPEHQRPVADVEPCESGQGCLEHGLTFEPGLGGAAPARAEHRCRHGGPLTGRVEAGVRYVEISLLGF